MHEGGGVRVHMRARTGGEAELEGRGLLLAPAAGLEKGREGKGKTSDM